jgi:hypothetical protein
MITLRVVHYLSFRIMWGRLIRVILTIAGAVIAVIITVGAALHCSYSMGMVSSIGIRSILFAFASEGCDEGGGSDLTIVRVSSWVNGCRHDAWSGEGRLDVVEGEPTLLLSDCTLIVVHVQRSIICHRIAQVA